MSKYGALLGRHKEGDNINTSKTFHCAVDQNGNVPTANYYGGRLLVFSPAKEGDSGTNTNFVNIGNGTFAGVSMGLDTFRPSVMNGADNPDISVITNSNSVVVEVAPDYDAKPGDVVSHNDKGQLVLADNSQNDIIGVVLDAKIWGERVIEGKIVAPIPSAKVRLGVIRRFGVTQPTPPADPNPPADNGGSKAKPEQPKAKEDKLKINNE